MLRFWFSPKLRPEVTTHRWVPGCRWRRMVAHSLDNLPVGMFNLFLWWQWPRQRQIQRQRQVTLDGQVRIGFFPVIKSHQTIRLVIQIYLMPHLEQLVLLCLLHSMIHISWYMKRFIYDSIILSFPRFVFIFERYSSIYLSFLEAPHIKATTNLHNLMNHFHSPRSFDF